MDHEYKNDNQAKKKIRFYNHILDLEHLNRTTIYIITETVDYIPVHSYSFAIPSLSFKTNSFIEKLDEITYAYYPNWSERHLGTTEIEVKYDQWTT